MVKFYFESSLSYQPAFKWHSFFVAEEIAVVKLIAKFQITESQNTTKQNNKKNMNKYAYKMSWKINKYCKLQAAAEKLRV